MLSSPDTLQILLARFSSMSWSSSRPAWSCLIVEDLATRMKCLQPSVLGSNCAFICPSTDVFFFACFNDVMAHFKLVNYQFPNFAMLLVSLCGFKIIYEVHQCTTCQRTNYLDTISNNRCLSYLIYWPKTNTYQNISKFWHPNIKKQNMTMA